MPSRNVMRCECYADTARLVNITRVRKFYGILLEPGMHSFTYGSLVRPSTNLMKRTFPLHLTAPSGWMREVVAFDGCKKLPSERVSHTRWDHFPPRSLIISFALPRRKFVLTLAIRIIHPTYLTGYKCYSGCNLGAAMQFGQLF
ncbi:hypothetical protein F5146DRAFT_1116750 [Armillaria mellea]|nr:hypothetical protein F5146DRAFT_1116750 [Armillaria mellea]